jgi:adenylate kinase
MGQVIYLTGAPATGKSPPCRGLEAKVVNLEIFSYSRRLVELVNRDTGAHVDGAGIRRESARVVSKANTNIVIDSHPVTKESFWV